MQLVRKEIENTNIINRFLCLNKCVACEYPFIIDRIYICSSFIVCSCAMPHVRSYLVLLVSRL